MTKKELIEKLAPFPDHADIWIELVIQHKDDESVQLVQSVSIANSVKAHFGRDQATLSNKPQS